MARRTRRKYTWFPIIGGDEEGGESGTLLSTVTRGIAVAADGTVQTDIIPLIPDAPDESPNDATERLVNFIGTSWFIKRLVGKLHLTYQQNSETPSGSGGTSQVIPAAAIVVAGFFVARVDATETSVPIGDNANLTPDYSPLALATQREPWMWRRSWMLGNNIAQPVAAGDFNDGQFYPATNASRSVLDGPHIDCKTARRSQNDERLWFALSTFQMPSTRTAEGDGALTYTLDLRVLGALRRQRNRSAF